tara:strand:+ start:8481 stop:9353 length:873 start_codon:yes stop_codon:yes gene_type:complete
MLIEEFINWLEKEKRYSQHTLLAYRTDLLQFEVYLLERYETKLLEANSIMIRSWMVEMMDEGMTTKSVNRKISSLKTFYNFQLKREQLKVSPMQKIIAPKNKKPLPAFVKNTEMESLFDRQDFADDFEGKRDELIIEILYACGIRLSELIGIEEKDLDLYQPTLKVLGKRNKERIIPMHKGLLQKVKAYIDLKAELFSSPFLLVTDKGEKLYPKFVYRKVNYYLSQVTTAKKKSPHILRHTFATHMLNNGADLNTIKELLGHTNLAATQVYTHNSIEKLKNIYKQAHPRA